MVELIWDGKYDENDKRVAPLKVALPFQTVETVNEDPQVRRQQLELFAAGRETAWRNRLIWGDKKYVLPSLLPEFAGQVDLIYIDPPFATGQDFSYQAAVGDERFTKEASIIETKAYRDMWGEKGRSSLDQYLAWFYETTVNLHELLSDTGSLYVHLDWHVAHYAKIILDQVFSYANFQNEIIWKRKTGRGQTKIARNFGTQTDSLFFYSKSESSTFENPIKPLRKEYVEKFYRHYDPDGRRYRIDNLAAPSYSPTLIYEYKGYQPPEKGWAISKQKMEQWETEGRLHFPKNKNGRIQRKRYLDENKGEVVQNLWDDIPIVAPQGKERLGYNTQKPEALLERIIKASSNEGDLVLDCFCGSGTTAAVAEKLNRRWIACDLGRFAIHTTRKRLLAIDNVRPFEVQNLGKYERQVWQKAEFGDEAAHKTRSYRKFILDLYHAELVEGYSWLHGKKGRRMVHVGSVDSPVATGDVSNIAIEFRKAIGTGKDAPGVAGVDILGWDFALDMNESALKTARTAGLDVKFFRIPREVLEQKAVDQGDIRFFELAALSVDLQRKGREITIELTDFMVPPDDVPEDVMKAVTHWSDWIDYWAVDLNYRDDTFHNVWQSYRTRQDRSLELKLEHRYQEAGDYVVLVKVIDILGNDTTQMIPVKVV